MKLKSPINNFYVLIICEGQPRKEGKCEEWRTFGLVFSR